MGDEVKIKLSVTDDDSIRTIEDLNKALLRTGSSALAADAGFQDFISDMNPTELQNVARQFGLIETKVDGVKTAFQRAAEEARQFREEQAKAARPAFSNGEVFGPFFERPERFGPLQSERTRQSPFAVRPDRDSAGQLSDRAVLARFNQAALNLNDVEKNAAKTSKSFRDVGDSAGKAAQLVHGATQIMEGDIVGAATNASQSLGDLFDLSKIIGPGAATIAGVGVVAIAFVSKITSDIKARAEAHLKDIEKIFAINNKGLTGGLSQTKTDLDEILKLQREVDNLRRAGDSAGANRLIKDTLGEGTNTVEFEARVKQTEERFRNLQRAAFQGGQDNIFKEAVSALAAARGQETTADRAFAFDLFKQFTDGKIGVEEFNKEIKRTSEEIKRAAETSAQFDQFKEKSLEAKRGMDAFRLSTLEALKGAFSGVRAEDTSNPFIGFLDAAESRTEQTLQKFTFLGDSIVSLFEERNARVLQLELFKAGLGTSQGAIAHLVEAEFTRRDRSFENANLQRGLNSADFEAQARALRAGEQVDPAELARRQFLEVFGSSASRSAINDAILKITGGLSPEDLDRSGLRNARIQALFDGVGLSKENLSQDRERARRQLESLDRITLAPFTNESDRRQAEGQIIDKVLSITQGLGENLTPELRERRALALERRAELDGNLLADAIKQKQEDRETNKRLALAIEKLIARDPDISQVEIIDRTTPGTVAIERAIGGAPVLSQGLQTGPTGPTASTPARSGNGLSNGF